MALYKNTSSETKHVITGESPGGIAIHSYIEPGETVDISKAYAERLGFSPVEQTEEDAVDASAKPRTDWTKDKIISWLDANDIDYEKGQKRSGLLAVSREHYQDLYIDSEDSEPVEEDEE